MNDNTLTKPADSQQIRSAFGPSSFRDPSGSIQISDPRTIDEIRAELLQMRDKENHRILRDVARQMEAQSPASGTGQKADPACASPPPNQTAQAPRGPLSTQQARALLSPHKVPPPNQAMPTIFLLGRAFDRPIDREATEIHAAAAKKLRMLGFAVLDPLDIRSFKGRSPVERFTVAAMFLREASLVVLTPDSPPCGWSYHLASLARNLGLDIIEWDRVANDLVRPFVAEAEYTAAIERDLFGRMGGLTVAVHQFEIKLAPDAAA
jgi:hypothetical protein